MSKVVMVVLFVVGIPLMFLAVSLFGGTSDQLSTILGFAGGLLTVIAWIGAIAKAAQLGHWAWFAIALVLGPLGGLAYALFGPSKPAQQPAS